MITELILKFSFEAFHALTFFDNEKSHPHLWKLEVSIQGAPVDGRLIDIPELRNQIDLLLKPLISSFLNENLNVSEEVRKCPTCETLSLFFKFKIENLLQEKFQCTNPSVRLSYLQVAICEMDGSELGAIKLTTAR